MHRTGVHISPPDTRLIDALMAPAAFEHPVTSVDLIETHISWVILTNDTVYKIKKPLVLDFLDFGDLERRRFFCEEEIRLNRPWAPEIYIDVVPITLENDRPRFGGAGMPIEYAVRMHRFDQSLRLDQQLEHDKLTVLDMKELGQAIATRHAAAPAANPRQRKHLLAINIEFMRDNFAALEGFIDNDVLASLSAWNERELDNVHGLLGRRFDDGFVRDCHGDLHLANLVRLPSGITTFDCIEFNSDLRTIDVICDIAFLVMDLVARQRHDLAAHFLNRYLEQSGDYAGVALPDLYFVYRCLVRAKVAAIRSEEEDSDADRQADLVEAHRYCDMALKQISKPTPVLIIMSGLSGSGKTRVSGELMAAMPAIRVRSGIERKRMFGLDETEDSASDIDKGIYTPATSRKVYSHLIETACSILRFHHNVILDAAFLHADECERAIRAARECGFPTVIVRVEAPIEVLRERIRRRAQASSDASEADVAVLEHQLASAEPLPARTEEHVIVCDNSGDVDVAALKKKIRRHADATHGP